MTASTMEVSTTDVKMLEETIVIEPDGDILLTAIPDPGSPRLPDGSKKPSQTFRVSSEHLRLGSVYLAGMVKQIMSEAGELGAKQPYRWNCQDADPDAIRIILFLLHNRTREVPETATNGEMVRLTRLADRFQCLEVIVSSINQWISQVIASSTWPSLETTAVVIFLSWKLELPDYFRSSTQEAAILMNKKFNSMELPIPPLVADAITENRKKGLRTLRKDLKDQRNFLIEHPDDDIHRGCFDIYLATFVRDTHNSGLDDLLSIVGCSLNIYNILAAFKKYQVRRCLRSKEQCHHVWNIGMFKQICAREKPHQIVAGLDLRKGGMQMRALKAE
ncbi:hypothetical protein FE257_007800 [Aspergillus nanangensis]|uniref:Uncharacterized protein n=1 Tax=Aspergillus nanangensis TaxID=2582783 RepID=A0AAD4GYR8_ASPNN|nr:hypothetical protein FE257_007800 [Aspergillus nanangensis]